jgi:hypothetical protein
MQISTMTDRTKKTEVKQGILLYLISIGIVGVVTIMLFSVACVSLLGTGKEPLTGCCVGEGVFQNLGGTAAPIPAQVYSPTPDSAKILPAFPLEGASAADEVIGTKLGVEVPLLDHDESTTTSEARDAAPIRGASVTKVESTAVGESEKATTERQPIDDEVNATPDASREIGRSKDPDEGQDQKSRKIEIQQPQPAKLNQYNVVSEEKSPAQNQRLHRQIISPNAAFQYRVQKECGPITFPVLRRHCMASFGVHHR